MQINPPRSLILQPRLEKEGEPGLPLPRRTGHLDNLTALCALNQPHQSANQILLTSGKRRPPQIVCCSIRLHLGQYIREPQGQSRGYTQGFFENLFTPFSSEGT